MANPIPPGPPVRVPRAASTTRSRLFTNNHPRGGEPQEVRDMQALENPGGSQTPSKNWRNHPLPPPQ